MFKKHSSKKNSVIALDTAPRHYWFTIQSPNGQTLATSETYTTAAMRDKGIEAVKKVVIDEYKRQLKDANGQLNNMMIRKPPKPSDTFHLENKHGKITKR